MNYSPTSGARRGAYASPGCLSWRSATAADRLHPVAGRAALRVHVRIPFGVIPGETLLVVENHVQQLGDSGVAIAIAPGSAGRIALEPARHADHVDHLLLGHPR